MRKLKMWLRIIRNNKEMKKVDVTRENTGVKTSAKTKERKWNDESDD